MIHHDAQVVERIFGYDGFYARAECECGWRSKWFKSLFGHRRPVKAANRHNRWAKS